MTRAERGIVIVLGLALYLPRAQAQSAEAEVLFQEGRAMVKQGRVGPGCDKIAASQRIEPHAGTALNLGDCREDLGQYATAWAAFREAEALAKRSGDDKREAEAHRRAASVESKLSYVTINVTARVAGLVVHRDEVALDGAAFGTPLPVDPGRYVIVAEAPGYKPWRTTLEVGKGKRQAVAIPALDRVIVDEGASGLGPRASGRPQNADLAAHTESTSQEARGPKPEAPASAPTPMLVTALAPAPHERSRSSLTHTRKIALGIGAAGLATIGAGIYLGFDARDKQAEADRRCPLTVCADPEAIRLNDRAQSSAMFANVSYAVGGAAVATSVVLWFVGSPRDTVVKPTFGDHQVGIAVAGSL